MVWQTRNPFVCNHIFIQLVMFHFVFLPVDRTPLVTQVSPDLAEQRLSVPYLLTWTLRQFFNSTIYSHLKKKFSLIWYFELLCVSVKNIGKIFYVNVIIILYNTVLNLILYIKLSKKNLPQHLGILDLILYSAEKLSQHANKPNLTCLHEPCTTV